MPPAEVAWLTRANTAKSATTPQANDNGHPSAAVARSGRNRTRQRLQTGWPAFGYHIRRSTWSSNSSPGPEAVHSREPAGYENKTTTSAPYGDSQSSTKNESHELSVVQCDESNSQLPMLPLS